MGFLLRTLKKHPSLIPLFAFVGLGVAGGFVYTIRLMIKNPEANFYPKEGSEPWDGYRNKLYKFYAPELKGKEINCPAPEY